MTFSWLLPLGFGLLSTVHCWGMCGGIIGAFGLLIPDGRRQRRAHVLAYAAAYNLGRVASYTLAGGIVGYTGSQLLRLASFDLAYSLLQVLAAIVLVIAGLNLAGWFPRMSALEALGIGLWRRLQPLSRRWLPLDVWYKALLIGTIWGWLPCGLVYSMLLASAATGHAGSGAAYMLAFGAGTLPGMIFAGFTLGQSSRLVRARGLRRIAGVAVITLALLWLAAQTVFAPTAGHDHTHHHVPPAETTPIPQD